MRASMWNFTWESHAFHIILPANLLPFLCISLLLLSHKLKLGVSVIFVELLHFRALIAFYVSLPLSFIIYYSSSYASSSGHKVWRKEDNKKKNENWSTDFVILYFRNFRVPTTFSPGTLCIHRLSGFCTAARLIVPSVNIFGISNCNLSEASNLCEETIS